ncbi:hypothetical protein [Gordonia soli]|nr:hypothetical protein [Gordonia soli]
MITTTLHGAGIGLRVLLTAVAIAVGIVLLICQSLASLVLGGIAGAGSRG